MTSENEHPGQLAEDPRELALFERAAELYQALGDVPGEAESLFWIGCFHQVVRRDNDAAVPFAEARVALWPGQMQPLGSAAWGGHAAGNLAA